MPEYPSRIGELIQRLEAIQQEMSEMLADPVKDAELEPGQPHSDIEYEQAEWALDSAIQWLKALRTPEFADTEPFPERAIAIALRDAGAERQSPWRAGPCWGYRGFKTHAEHVEWITALEGSERYAEAPEQLAWIMQKAIEMCPTCREEH